jgi:putative flippase GtrA
MLFARFLFIGVFNTVFGYAIYGLAISIGLHFGMALLIATLVGVVFNYFTNRTYVFKSKKERAFIAFIAAYAVVYALNYVGIFFLKSLGNSSYIAALIMLPLSAMLSFVFNKKVVFRNAQTN